MCPKRRIWAPIMEERLVTLIKENEFIWNTGNENFLNLRKRKETLAQIAKTLGPNFTVSCVKERWRNIKNTHRHNLRRMKASHQSGNQLDAFEPSWHLWPSLQFLRDIDKSDDTQDLAFDDINAENNSYIIHSSFIIPSESNDFQNILYNIPQDNETTDQMLDVSQGSCDKSECEDLLSEARHILRDIESDPRLDFKTDSRYYNFGKKVSNCLSEMPICDAKEASSKIINILSSYNQSFNDYFNDL